MAALPRKNPREGPNNPFAARAGRSLNAVAPRARIATDARYQVSTYGRFLVVRGGTGGRLFMPLVMNARVSAGSMTYRAPELMARADS